MTQISKIIQPGGFLGRLLGLFLSLLLSTLGIKQLENLLSGKGLIRAGDRIIIDGDGIKKMIFSTASSFDSHRDTKILSK